MGCAAAGPSAPAARRDEPDQEPAAGNPSRGLSQAPARPCAPALLCSCLHFWKRPSALALASLHPFFLPGSSRPVPRVPGSSSISGPAHTGDPQPSRAFRLSHGACLMMGSLHNMALHPAELLPGTHPSSSDGGHVPRSLYQPSCHGRGRTGKSTGLSNHVFSDRPRDVTTGKMRPVISCPPP